MESSRFKIIFDQTREALKEGSQASEAEVRFDDLMLDSDELDEIETLRRIVLEIQEPEQSYYTTS